MLIRRARQRRVGWSSWYDFLLARPWERNGIVFRFVVGLEKNPKQPSDKNPFSHKEAKEDVAVLREFRCVKKI